MARKKTFKDLQRSVRKATQRYADTAKRAAYVGLPNDRRHNPSGLMLSELGAIHEFGTSTIPARPFLRGFLADEKSAIREEMIATMERIAVTGKVDENMEMLALWGQGGVQEYIANGRAHFEPLKRPRSDKVDESGVADDNPLNDTGEMRQGIIGVVREV